MAQDPINQFLSKWETLPGSGEECLSHEYLAELSKGKGKPEWNEHVNSCAECREILSVLRDKSQVTKFMDEFIKMKADKAQVVSSTRSHSILAYLKALLWINQPKWGAVALAISFLALLTFGVSSYLKEFRARQQPAEVAYLEKDDYSYAEKTLQTAMHELPEGPLPIQGRAQQIVAINKNIGEVNEGITTINRLYGLNRIQPDQRGQINNLLVNYRSRLALIRASLDVNPQSKPSQQIAVTPDTDAVVSLLMIIHQANTKKNGAPDDSPPTELQQAEVIRKTDLDVVRIDNEPSNNNEPSIKVFSFRGRLSELSPKEQGELENIVNSNSFVTKQGLKAKFLTGTSFTTARGAGTISVPR